IYLTINVSDATITTLDIQSTTVKFEGQSNDKKYAFELELHAAVNPETSKKANTKRNIFLVLDKKEHDKPYWPRLQQGKTRPNFLKTDFSKWKDEDEEDEEEEGGMPGMGGAGGMPGMMGGAGGMPGMMGGMGGAGGMPDFGGMDFSSLASGLGGGAGGMPDFSAMGAGAGGMPDFGAMGAEAGDMPSNDEEDAAEAQKKD
ncbi:p23 chaperone protein wos2, partial [Dispira parvispora]